MRKIILILALCLTAFAQLEKKTVAVYMAGKEPSTGVHKVIGTELAKALTKSDKYTAVDRTEEGSKIVSAEHIFQRSGAVDLNQIKKLGKQLGVAIVCIAEITEIANGHYLRASLVDVETAILLSVEGELINIMTAADIVQTAQAVARKLVSGEETSAPALVKDTLPNNAVKPKTEEPIIPAKSIKPSFDCSKISTPTEKVICSDAELAGLDVSVSELYKPLAKELKDSQIEWIKERDKCGDNVGCLKREYQSRLIFLQQYNLPNANEAKDASGGIGDMLGGLMGGSKGGIGTKAKSSLKAPSINDIYGSTDGIETGSRSKAEIMAVVNARMPSLRNIYNKYLKLKPGFSGKIILKFTIAPSGNIINISIVSSTTGYVEFDNAIKDMVATWEWKAIKNGNTTPTIPFSFTE